MYRLFWLYVFFGVPVYAAPVIPNFRQGGLQQHVETKSTIVEDIKSRRGNMSCKNIRVKICNGNYKKRIGEIISKNNNLYKIRLANNYVTFDSNDQYKIIYEKYSNLIQIDYGINSPFKIHFNNLIKIL